jgi:hypothetical protein
MSKRYRGKRTASPLELTAHFTNYGYLSMPRFFFEDFINDRRDGKFEEDIEEFFIKIGTKEFNVEKLFFNISYTEHEFIYRWDIPAWQKCVCDGTISPHRIETTRK